MSCVTALSTEIVPLTFGADGLPIADRSTLDALELEKARAHLPGLNNIEVPPKSTAALVGINQLRESHWAAVCGKQVRLMEIVVTKSVVDDVETLPQFGGTFAEWANAQVAELNRIIETAPDPVERLFVLDRIMVVDDKVVSGPQSGCESDVGWQVCNVDTYSLWANDRLNGIEGDIPYDIDSRWVLDDHWADYVLDWAVEAPHPRTASPFAMDYALLHEFLHHLCMGDLYWYNPGEFQLVQPDGGDLDGVTARIRGTLLNENDAMWNPSAAELSSLSSLAQRYCMTANPSLARSSQHLMAHLGNNPYIDPYTQAPASSTLTVGYGPLVSKVVDCQVAHPVADPSGIATVTPSTTFVANHTDAGCTVVFSTPNYLEALWPIFYVVLEIPLSDLGASGTGNVAVPIPFQRVDVNALVWGASEDNALTVTLTSQAVPTFRGFAEHLLEGAESIVSIGDPAATGDALRIYSEPFSLGETNAFAIMPLPGSVSGVRWSWDFL